MPDVTKPLVMTLGAQTLVTDPRAIIAYQLRYFIYAPLSVSDTYQGMAVSLADCVSRFGRDRSAVIGPITTQLTDMFTRIFGEDSVVTVDVRAENTNSTDGQGQPDIYYTLRLGVQVTYNGIIYPADPTIYVENGNLVLSNDIISVGSIDTQDAALS